MHLTSLQAKWIRRFVFNQPEGKAPRGMYDEAYRRYHDELGGGRRLSDYTNFLSRNKGSQKRKGSQKPIDSWPDDEAELALKSIGLSLAKLSAIDAIIRDMTMRDIKIEDVSTISNAEEQFLEACASLLWTKNGNDFENKDIDLQEPLLQLLDSIIEHTETFTYAQKRLIFHELFDFLVENRHHERWERWVKSIAREYRIYFCAHIQKGYSDWFPGCIVKDDGTIDVDTEVINLLTKEELDEMAFLISCKDMDVNHIRHAVFSHTIQIERLTSKIANLKKDPNADPSELSNAVYDIKEHKSAKQKGKRLLRMAFGEIRRYIKPVWEKVCKSENPNKWYFLYQCTRLFYDFARYHYYSSLKEDRVEAIEIYGRIVSVAHCAVKDEHIDAVLACRFSYLSATACRYQAEYASNNIRSIDLILTAMKDSGFAVGLINDESRCGHLSQLTRKALEYRFTRHHGRTMTFAMRWWLKHECPNLLFGDIVNREDEFRHAERCYHDSVCKPLGLDEGRENVIILRDKRKLEWEFHLRVTIEMLAKELDWIVCNTNVSDKIERAASDDLLEAEKAFCLIVAIYCYLFSARETELESHRPFTHISHEVEVHAIKCLESCGEEPEFMQFNYTHLRGIKQSEPPSLTSQLETICAILFRYDYSKDEILPSFLTAVLDNGLSGPTIQGEHKDFRDNIWMPVKEALRRDKENVEKIFMSEIDEFGKVTKLNYKEYPLYRHRFEMVYGPGSNAREIDAIFSYLGLNWNPVKAEVVQ